MDQATAHGAGYAAGTIFGYLFLYGGLLALGIFFGKRLARKRDTAFVRWPVGVACALILLLLAGQCSRTARARTMSDAGGAAVPVQDRADASARDQAGT